MIGADIEAGLRRLAVAWLALVAAALAMGLWPGDAEVVRLLNRAAWVQAHRELVRALTDWSLYVFYGLFAAVLALGLAQRRRALVVLASGYLVAQLLGSVLLVRVLKVLTGRARPHLATDPAGAWAGPAFDAPFHSFPSGHSADLFTGAIFVGLLAPWAWARAASVAFAAAAATTRIALARHYPTDVAAGAFIGGAAALIVAYYWVIPRLSRRDEPG